MTRSGVERDLAVSPFTFELDYLNGQAVEYHFSSEKLMNKFINGRTVFASSLLMALEAKLKISLDGFLIVCDLAYYERIESRGYYIKMDGEVIQWPGELRLFGAKVERNKSREKLQIITSV